MKRPDDSMLVFIAALVIAAILSYTWSLPTGVAFVIGMLLGFAASYG